MDFRLTTFKDLFGASCRHEINFQSKQIKLGKISTSMRHYLVVENQKSEE